MKRALSTCVAFAVILGASIATPEAKAQGLTPEDYGIEVINFHYISAEEFQETTRGYYRLGSDGFWSASTSGIWGTINAHPNVRYWPKADGQNPIFLAI